MWIENNNKIINQFTFRDFKSAIMFVNKVAEIAERLGHHPDIEIFDYKKVKISSSTHSESKVTGRDWQLATEIDKINI